MRINPRLLSELLDDGGAAETIIASPPLTVESIDNHIYFYAQVDSDRALATIRQIRQIDSDLQLERMQRSLPSDYPQVPIWLHIQSGGGWVHSGFGLLDAIKATRTPVYTIIEGFAASAATFISMAGARRYITPNSFIMIHQASTGFWGKHNELEDEVKVMRDILDMMVQFYVKHSKLNEAEVRALLDHDSWMTAAQAIEMGLVDGIYGGTDELP